MNKIYQKSESWFAFLWIIIYVVGTSISDVASEIIGVTKSITLIFHVILCIIAFIWLKKNNLYTNYGLCKSEVKSSNFLYYIPLIIVASTNLWFGVKLNLPIHETITYVFSMICVGFLEELIFRGFLFKSMCRINVKFAIIISSITFGIGHIVNLINGSGADILSNICQIFYATAFGFMFSIIFYKGKSLLPCIITHSTINALSAFANESNVTEEKTIIATIISSIIAILYTAIILKNLPKIK